jgi:hypothetical protein
MSATDNHTEEIKGYAAFEAKGQLKPFAYTPRPLGEEDVDILITHCGICSSDLHTIDSGWGPSNFPGTLSLSSFSPSLAPEVTDSISSVRTQWCLVMRSSAR